MPVDQQQGASPLTAITPVIPGKEAALQAALEDVQRRLDQAGPSGLSGVGTVHFARWVLLRDADQAQLLFASNFDGPWEVYLDDFIDHAWEVFDAIYSHCEGYPEYGARDSAAFKAFVREHQLKEDVSYRAYPDASVREIKRALKTTRSVRDLLEGLQEL